MDYKKNGRHNLLCYVIILHLSYTEKEERGSTGLFYISCFYLSIRCLLVKHLKGFSYIFQLI